MTVGLKMLYRRHKMLRKAELYKEIIALRDELLRASERSRR